MIKNKFLALAMAAAMTLVAAVPAFASSGTTKVSLTVPQWNSYTLTVPADTELNIDGTAKQLSGGIKITDGNLVEGMKLTVTATSKNEWKMKATDEAVKTEIGYGLYSDSDAETAATTWEFTKEEANTGTTGTTKDVYAKANTDEMYEAASGVYSDVITFTAEVKSATPRVSFSIDGSQYSVAKDTTWSEFVAGDGSSFLKISGNNVEQSNRSGFFVFTDSPFAKVNASDVITDQAYVIYAAS